MTKAVQIKNMALGEGLPKICVPLTGDTREALLSEAAGARSAAPDIVEWRADFYEKLKDTEQVQKMLQELSEALGGIPLLFTIRTVAEGGKAVLSGEEYARINELAAESGKADVIDVEVFQDMEAKKTLIRYLHEKGAVVIASSHDFQKTGEREALLDRFLLMDQTGADILKMAVMPNTFEDVTALMDTTHKMARILTEKPLIAMSMGGLGAISRICGEQYGSSLTFATVGAASAPGQIPIRELRPMMERLHLGG